MDEQIITSENGREISETYLKTLQELPDTELSTISKKIHTAAINVLKNKNNQQSELNYLSNFPKSCRIFEETFNPKNFDQLYDGHIYISLIGYLAEKHPEKVGGIFLSLASDACLSADAPNYLKNELIHFEKKHPLAYMLAYKKLTSKQRKNVNLFKSASLNANYTGGGLCKNK